MDEIDRYINNFASRSFRDIADGDYINARMCYRAHLVTQFHWSALQAFEKYYKAIFLYNRIEAKNIGHSLSDAQLLAKKLPFNIKLSETSTKLIEHLDLFGRHRYLESSYYIRGPKILELDKAVWELRRYCDVIDYKIVIDGNPNPINMLESKLNDIEKAEKSPHSFQLIQGKIESILKKKDHPARGSLIWQNPYFGTSRRKKVSIPIYFYSENSPLSLYPEMLDRLSEYIFLPKNVKAAYSEIAKQKIQKSIKK